MKVCLVEAKRTVIQNEDEQKTNTYINKSKEISCGKEESNEKASDEKDNEQIKIIKSTKPKINKKNLELLLFLREKFK